MLFSVIYSVDVPENLDCFAPPHVDELWEETENGATEYRYLEGEWTNGTHKKWCALLTRSEFEEFVQHCGLTADSCETMGSIGAIGCGFGWSPAISFSSNDYEYMGNAYVTPLPEVKKKELNENDWNRIKKAILSLYS